MTAAPSAAGESVYVLPGEVSAQAITESLRALLHTRRHVIARQCFTLLDTFDGRVRRAGACLSLGRVNGASVVAWQPRGGPRQLTDVPSEPVHFAWDLPEGPFRHAVASVIGVRRLLAQADAEEHGALLDMLDRRGKTVARLRIASGRIRLPTPRSAWRPLPTLITLTPLRGYEDACRQLVPVIESRPGSRPCHEGPLDVMLREAGAPARVDLSSPRVDLDPGTRADVGARQIYLAVLGILAANESGLRDNLDTEFLHDFRVAIRRTRSLLRQIRDVFPPEVVQHFSGEFSWIGRLTGPLRDLDVLALMLRERGRDLPAADVDAILAFLSRMRRQDHDGLVQALDSDRYRRLMLAWRRFLEQPASSSPESPRAGETLAAVVSHRAWRLSRRIADGARSIDVDTTAEQLHALRIDAKKLRYLVDVTPASGDRAHLESVLAALKKLQRALGDFNDAHVQEKRLLEHRQALGATGSPPSALLTIGRLAEEARQRRDALRPHVVEKLRRFLARDTRTACRRAFKSARSKEPVR